MPSRAPGSLWTPGGEVAVMGKDVVPLTRPDILMLVALSDFAAKHRITIYCQKCEQPIRGDNTGQESHPSVACTCREFRYSGA